MRYRRRSRKQVRRGPPFPSLGGKAPKRAVRRGAISLPALTGRVIRRFPNHTGQRARRPVFHRRAASPQRHPSWLNGSVHRRMPRVQPVQIDRVASSQKRYARSPYPPLDFLQGLVRRRDANPTGAAPIFVPKRQKWFRRRHPSIRG